MHRRVRLTPLGYVVAAVLILLILGGLYLIIRGIGGDGSAGATPTPPLANTASASPSVSPDLSTSTSPGLSTQNPALGSPTPSLVSTNPPTQVPTTAAPTNTPATVRTPSPDEKANAKEGKLTTGGVVLRAAPNTDGAILGKYISGTNLEVYGESGDYYFVQIVKEGVYGYMAKKFIEVNTATPEPITTSVPSGAVGGTVRASIVALRSAPDLEDDGNKVGQIEQGEPVYIYFKYTNASGDTFYYIEVARTGAKAYTFAEYITAESSVPTGTPVP